MVIKFFFISVCLFFCKKNQFKQTLIYKISRFCPFWQGISHLYIHTSMTFFAGKWIFEVYKLAWKELNKTTDVKSKANQIHHPIIIPNSKSGAALHILCIVYINENILCKISKLNANCDTMRCYHSVINVVFFLCAYYIYIV